MEFIPLEDDSDKRKKNKRKAVTVKSPKKLKRNEESSDVNIQKTKKSGVLGKKSVKNKYKETLALKRKNKAPKKKNKKIKEDDEELKEKEEEEVEDEDVGEEEDDEEKDEEDEEKNKAVEAFKRKCKQMDEKKKNRLFLKLKKKIHNEAMIKELHPNIKGVIFPRKKNSRWCWAVFASEKKADEALKQLIKNKEVFASKPNPYERVDQKQKEKMKTVLRKKETKKKLQNIWI